MMLGLLSFLLLPTLAFGDPLPEGVSCSSQFTSPDSALIIPDASASWTSYRIFDCQQRIFWLELQTTEDHQRVQVTAKVPVLDRRFESVQVSVALVGPSLPLQQDVKGRVQIPPEIVQYAKAHEGYGYQVLTTSFKDLALCDFVHNQDSLGGKFYVVDKRCQYRSNHRDETQLNDWVVNSGFFETTVPGRYKIAVFVQDEMTAKVSLTVDGRGKGGHYQSQSSMSPQEPPASCPFCGTSPLANPNWLKHFYEEDGTMDDPSWGGFPRLQRCLQLRKTMGMEPAVPEQCPPTDHGDSNEEASTRRSTRMVECKLQCHEDGICKGEIHGKDKACLYTLDWSTTPQTKEGMAVENLVVQVGDHLWFQPNAEIYEMVNARATQNCDFTDAVDVQGGAVTLGLVGIYRYSKETRCSLKGACQCDPYQNILVQATELPNNYKERSDKFHSQAITLYA